MQVLARRAQSAHRGSRRLVRVGAPSLEQASGCRGERVDGPPRELPAGPRRWTGLTGRAWIVLGRADDGVVAALLGADGEELDRTALRRGGPDAPGSPRPSAAASVALGVERHARVVRRPARRGSARRALPRPAAVPRDPARLRAGRPRTLRCGRRRSGTPHRRRGRVRQRAGAVRSRTATTPRPGLPAASTSALQEFAPAARGDRRLGRPGPPAPAHRGRVGRRARSRSNCAPRGCRGMPRPTTRILTEMLGERPAGRRRTGEARASAASGCATALGDPAASLDSQPKLLRSLHRAGVLVESTSRWELAEHRHPVIEPLLEYKKLSRLLSANGWSWLAEWVHDGRFRPVYVPGGVVTGPMGVVRRRCAAAAATAARGRARRSRLAPRRRRRRTARAARARRDGRRHRAGRCRARAGPVRRHRRHAARSPRAPRRRSPCSGRCTARRRATAGDSCRACVARSPARWRSSTTPPARARTAAWSRPGSDAARRRPRRRGTTRSRGRPRSRHPAADETRARRWARDRGRFTRNFVVQGTAAEWALAWMADLRGRLAAMPPVARARCRAPVRAGLRDGGRTSRSSSTTRSSCTRPPSAPMRPRQAVRDAAAAAGRLLFGDFPIDFPLDLRIAETRRQGLSGRRRAPRSPRLDSAARMGRLDGRVAAVRRTRRGTSGLHRAGRWVTPTRSDPRDSATENRPPRLRPR